MAIMSKAKRVAANGWGGGVFQIIPREFYASMTVILLVVVVWKA